LWQDKGRGCTPGTQSLTLVNSSSNIFKMQTSVMSIRATPLQQGKVSGIAKLGC
jgi:hypothetical protein